MVRFALTRCAFLFSLTFVIGCGGGDGGPVTGEVKFGNVKPAAGDVWSVSISDGSAKSYSSEVDATGKFKFEKVAPGTYSVTVTHYKTASDDGKGGKPKAPPAPTAMPYPDKWTVPGGPFTLDMARLTPSKS